MRKIKRILSFIMACVVFISSANAGVYATEIDESAAMVEEAVETTETLNESTETVEFAESVGDVVNETANVSIENQQELPNVRDYDDLLEMEAVEIDPNEIEGEVYDADELAALAKNMPAMMSTSYNLYWDNYSSYYIYNHLSEDKQKLWDALEVLCASYLEDETDLTNGLTAYVSIDTTETITAEDLMGFANMFKYAHPQYYYLRSGYSYYAGETRVGLAFMVYDAFKDGADRKNATNAVKAQLDTWCEQIALGSTEEEKVKIIHDIICDNVDYNHGVLAGDSQISSEEEEIYFTQSAYSVFCTDLTVCAGYTQTFMWLCNAFDIGCFGVTSPGHAWNKVKVNDNWYNLDATWDDGEGVGDRDYHCYLKNDAYMESIGSHEEEAEWLPYLPSCTLDSGSDYWEAGTLPTITQKVATPTISVVEEDTAYAVTIESATAGAKIFYTLDGKTPSETNSKGDLYTGAFRINQTVTIQAIAVCDGYLDSAIAEGHSIEEIEYIVDSGSCGTNVTWQLDSKGILTISGSGDMESYASVDAVPWYIYSQDIQSVEIEDGVTSIGDYAFGSVTNVQVIELPDSITKIGDYAFYRSNLVEIEIPAGVTEIGMYAFASCYDLAHVKICGNPTTIGERVFENCDKLTEVELSDIYTKIGTMMFFSCDGLVSIELPESLTEIGQQALSYCSKLEEVTIPANVVMKPYAFYSNTGLKKVTIENGVVAIPYGAFYLCSALEEIRIPKSVTSIGNIAIDGTTTIYGYAGSAAETYANNNGNPFVDVSTTEYEVRFVTGTEEQIASVICQRESLITEPVLSARMGYTFGGWYTSDKIHDETTEWDFANDTVTKAMTLYAYWIPNEYEVTFNAGEGTLGTTKITVTYDAVYGELPTPVRENYTFLGWYTALEDGTLVNAETIVKIAGNHTLYALYEVTIVAQGEYNGTFGTGSWKLDALETMTVSGYAGSWYDIAPEHKEATLKLVLEEGITSIDDSAFMNFVNVTKVVLPESLTEIGSQAFMGCTSLVEINLPNSVATIGEYAFNNCTALQQINLPNGLTEISPYVFAGCRLTSIEIPASVTEIRDSAFFGCSFTSVTVPDTVTEIEEYAFNACKNLETVTLSTNITYIGEGLFAACEKLSEVTIPTGVTSIGAEAFRECSALTEFVLPANVETIGANAFESCVGLTELVIPVNVETIGANAFEGCTGLTEMTIPGNVKTLGEELFYGCRGLTSVIFEEGVETLGARALYDCNNLEYVYLAGSMSYDAPIFNDVYCDVHTKLLSAGPENGDYDVEFGWTEEIPSYAFANLVSLQSCVIPSTVTEIGERAFMSTGLTAVDIPSSVTSIGDAAFIDCNALTQVYVPKTVTSIGMMAFTSTTTIKGFVGSAAHDFAVENGNTFIDILDEAIKVSFVTGIEAEVEPQYYLEPSFAVEPIGLEKTGYTLEGWYTSAEVQDENTKWVFLNNMATEDVTLYAKWTQNIYQLSYDLNYEGADKIEGKSVTYDAAYGTLYEPTCTGYTFLGWFSAIEDGVQIIEEDIYTIASDSTIYAHWKAVGYTVTFDANGGELENTELLVTYDSTYGELPVPAREGYEFIGWFTDKNDGLGITEDTKVTITAPQTLYARWEASEYDVTFDTTGGIEISNKKKVIFDEVYGELPVAERVGHTFKCWCLEDGTIVTPASIVRVAKNHSLYAEWIPNTYKVSFDLGYESTQVVEDKDVVYGTSYGILEELNRVGYTFLGWYAEAEEGAQITEESIFFNTSDTTIYAHWKANTYTVTLDATGGTVEVAELLVTYDSAYGELPIAEKIGYSFLGWYMEDDTVISTETIVDLTEDHILYAQWTPNTYQLSYDLNYEGADEVEGKSVTYDVACGTLYEPIRTGYTFLGWYTASEDGVQITENSIYKIASDSTVYAHWKADSYTVTFDINGGDLDNRELIVTYDSVYGELPVPTKVGYDFIGWFTDKNVGQEIKEDTRVTITAPQTLYARWKASVYEVTFDATGGAEITDIKKVTFGEPYGELPITVREGSAFIGWYLEDGTEIVAETIVSITENHTLYAKWGYKVAALEAKPASGEVEKGARVSIETATNGAKIYYTTNSEVNLRTSAKNGTLETDAILYEDAIEITEAVTIYAIAVKDGYGSSDVLTVSYTVKDESKDWGDLKNVEEDKALFENPDAVPKELWVAGIKDCGYTGKTITQDFRVYSHKTLLVEKVDYTVKYKNNKNAGTATITITGKGNYTGSIVKTFKIRPLDISNAIVLDVAVPYNGKVQKATTTVTYLLDEKIVTLKKGTDFIYSYPGTNSKDKETYDAAAFKEVNEELGYTDYTVILIGKGNYTGNTTFTQRITKQYVIGKMKLTSIKSQPYNEGNSVEPEITLMNGSEKLVGCKAEEFEEGKEVDFTVAYENNRDVGTATVTITGNEARGYVGTRTTTFKINGIALNKAKMSGFVSSLLWSETPVTQNVTFTYTTGSGENKVTRELKGCSEEQYEEKRANGEKIDYTVRYEKNTTVGTATVIYTGKRGFTGTIKKTFKITGLPMNKAVVENLVPLMAYDGEEVKLTGYDLKYIIGKGDEAQTVSLKEGENYTVSYKNNTKAGTATIIFTGINGYTGTLKKTFKITAYDFGSTDARASVTLKPEWNYAKGGVLAKPVVEYTNTAGDVITLIVGTDYTLTYSNNKVVADKNVTKAPTVIITGKNGFKGKLTEKFSIIEGDMSKVTMTATNITYQNKSNICKSKIVLTDIKGKKLVSNTDYDKNIVYTYARDVEVTQLVNKKPVAVKRYEGGEVKKDDIIPVGAEIKATVEGIKNYSGKKSVVFRYVAGDIAKATIKVADQIYTGKEVKPTKNDITVKIGKVTLEKTDYVIVDYINNTKKGTAKITIRGIGNYGGEKTTTYKINTKTMNYTIVYDKNADNATGKMKNSVIPTGKNLTANAYKRAGYTFVGWTTNKDGSGEFYNNKDKFKLNDGIKKYGLQVTLFAQWVPTEYKITYKLNGSTDSIENPVVYNIETETIVLKEPARDGYVFDGWYTNSKFSSKSLVTEITTGSTGNKTLYAKWIKAE